MKHTIGAGRGRRATWSMRLAVVLVSSASVPLSAGETPTENARLAAMLRQLNLIEHLAQEGRQTTSTAGTRYHFDYARLHADIARMRSGIEDYLSPPRAQPRDPSELAGNYRRESSEQSSP